MIRAIGTERVDLFDAFSQLMYNSSHDITVLEGAFGRPREILFSDVHDDFFVTAVLDYGDRTRCVWETGRVLDLVEWDEQITAYGSRGRVTIKFPFPYLKNAPTQILVNETDGDANIDKQIVSSFDEAFKREWRHFYSCVTEDREPLTNAEKARADIEFLIGLIKRARP
jgi:predicted dehydrogenase